MTPVPSRLRRKGAIAPMTAIFAVFLLGMVAFAIDTSWIVLAQSELQNAADAAALAGAQQLYNNYSQISLPGLETSAKDTLTSETVDSAKAKAKEYAGYNGAGGVASLTLADSDISVGFTNAAGSFTAFASGGSYPNTVKVTARRDSTSNQPLQLFFAPVLGTSNISLTATATCTLYTGIVNSFKSTATGIMPVTYDVNDWKTFRASGVSTHGAVSQDADGNPQLQVYDGNEKDTGNFGLLSLNDSNHDANTIKTWIDDGPTETDMKALLSSQLIPIDTHDATKWDWSGAPGFQATDVMTMNGHANETFWLPLFTPKVLVPYEPGVGQGNNYDYNIVAFVPVKIMPVESKDKNRIVVVQPVAKADPNAIFDSKKFAVAGTESVSDADYYYRTAVPPKLTQ